MLTVPRLQRLVPITDKDGNPTRQFHQWWDKTAKAIEDAFNQLAETVAATEAAQAAADAANSAADAAQTAATTAQTAADTVTAETALVNSYISGAGAPTATDAGASATISIAAHTRYYGDGTNVSVNLGTVTGLAYSTLYYVYYDDASRAGGAVTYAATTNAITAAQTGNRHLVGSVTTPAGGGGPTSGGGVQPPGIGDLP